MSKNKKSIVIETRTSKIWIEEEIVRIKSDNNQTLIDANENIDATLMLIKGRKYLHLVDIRKVRSVSKEARDRFAKDDARIANALLIGSIVSKLIGNFFMGFSKPVYPTKLFTSEEKAIKWLKLFL